ncbi:MAG: hypothetical protein U5K70_04440 [Halodesulfurarchaeum sp.]|nr:hypothetical protein [Halodesulfurarchaeum sp.]
MRRSAHWMEQVDERILEHLDSEGWGTPTMMAEAIEFTASTGRIGERWKTPVRRHDRADS